MFSSARQKLIRDCISTAFPNSTIATAQLLTGGLINTNIKIEFSSRLSPVVLRLYQGDAAVCLKEYAILDLVSATLPVPAVIHVEPYGVGNSGPFCILEFVNGKTFQQLKRSNDLPAINQAASSVGEILARIGRYQFSKPGRLEGEKDLTVGDAYVEGTDPVPRLVDLFLQSEQLQQRIDSSFQRKLHDFIWSWAIPLRTLDHDRHLVHSDFGNRNILVDCVNGRWQVAAVLDWEFAFSGSPLLDVGHFLRYESRDAPLREPHFSRAYVESGGSLPDDWRRLAQVVDLTALVECLTHSRLPDDLVSEILQLLSSTLEHCRL